MKAAARPGYQEVRVYVEGGGTHRADQSTLRQSFSELLGAALAGLPRPRLIACGGRGNTFDEFRAALGANRGALCLLLVDSEGPVASGSGPWSHVRERSGDRWEKPEGVSDDQLHFMVETMEAWIVADPDALLGVYGPTFDAGALPRANLERVPKKDVLQKLARALRDTGKEYSKSTGWVLIGRVDPRRLESACPHAARFFDSLRRACAALPRPRGARRPGA